MSCDWYLWKVRPAQCLAEVGREEWQILSFQMIVEITSTATREDCYHANEPEYGRHVKVTQQLHVKFDGAMWKPRQLKRPQR